jgi:DNA topoisomerase-1
MSATKLLIVESPAKCKKIQEYLGDDWRIQATMGHIRALKEDLDAIGFPKGGTGVPIWRPSYENIAAKAGAIANLRRAAAGMEVFLGADDDREGEAIAWHTCALLGLDPATTPRVIFHEITAPALRAAVAAPGRIDLNKFNAQQARSMLDLLIGFTLSPCLWRGVGYKPGLSAGRCQTPALHLIYDRDREIEGHAATNSWRITATTEDAVEDSTLEWTATGVAMPSQDAANAIILQLTPSSSAAQTLTVTDRQERVATSQPPKPFITSSLQQEASSRMSLNPKRTMQIAQKLYEGGHITYMRTDNAILSQEAIEAASAVVKERWGEEYLGGLASGDATATAGAKKVVKKKKTSAEASGKPGATADKPEAQATASVLSQNAHEGIRPTHMEVDDLADVDATEQRLYRLIWTRTIQSVMAPEQRDVVKLTATPTGNPTLLTLTTDWEKTRFAGWRALDAKEDETAAAYYTARADLTAGTLLDWQKFVASEVRSSPPGRYTEASLIRELESRGIGRPSTFATLVETVLDREYVEKATIKAEPVKLGVITLEAGKAAPKATIRTEKAGGEKDKLRTTALGRTVIEWLISQFDDMVDYGFTATMESELDEVSKGRRDWSTILAETWDRYKERYCVVMAAPKPTTTIVTAEDGTTTTVTTPARSATKAEFGDGYKMIISKKGPLFVLERDGEKTRFASVPAHLSIATASRTDVEAAFGTTAVGPAAETLGDLDDTPVQRRSGRYGPYVTWGTVTMNCRAEDTLDDLTPRLRAKTSPDTVDHLVGEYKIKKGPYGLYMFKVTAPGSKTKPAFVSIPDTTPWATLTPEGATELYKHAATVKKEARTAKKVEAEPIATLKKPRAAPRKKATATDA